jgi:hypothetical protein
MMGYPRVKLRNWPERNPAKWMNAMTGITSILMEYQVGRGDGV